jgi:hypothetical protein
VFCTRKNQYSAGQLPKTIERTHNKLKIFQKSFSMLTDF